MSQPSPYHSDPLFGERAQAALRELNGELDPLRAATKLQAELESELARRCAELHQLRLRSRSRFPNEFPLFMTAPGLSRASSEAAANARAAHILERLPRARVSDATCGIGADAMALCRAGARVIASDIDSFLVACTQANLHAWGHEAHVVVADCRRHPATADVLVLDPDRRPNGERTLDPARWSPPLSAALELAGQQARSAHRQPRPLVVRPRAAQGARLPWHSCRAQKKAAPRPARRWGVHLEVRCADEG